MSWVVVYSDDRELDVQEIGAKRNKLIKSGELKLLKTGPGKVPAATALAGYLSSSLRTGKSNPPQVISVGLAVTSEWTFVGLTVEPYIAFDRDTTPEAHVARGIEPLTMVKLRGKQDFPIASGDNALFSSEELMKLRERNVHLMDVESHALGWVSIRCLAGQARSVRYVTHDVDSPPKSWEKTYLQASKALTTSVLTLTDEGTDT